MDTVKNGLEGRKILATSISFSDGEEGLLEYRRHRLEDLVDLDYKTVSYLLVFGHMPSVVPLTRGCGVQWTLCLDNPSSAWRPSGC